MRGRRGIAMLAAACAVVLSGCGTPGGSASAPGDDDATGAPSEPAAPTSSITLDPTANPLAGRPLYVWPGAKAATAVSALSGADQAIVQRLAATPTAIWLTPEGYPTATVGSFVASTIAAAGTQQPVFVIYGIPDRDCSGGHSSGGLDASTYPAWVQAIGDALTNNPVVILEPDALATAQDCGVLPQREELIDHAIGLLAGRASVYVDAGHSDWIAPQAMAQMLAAVGVERVRGFAVNVSGYDDDGSERAYAEAVLAGVPGSHYVIDSSRNGVGGTGEWCNPPGRALGAAPGAVEDGSGLDGHLWVKPPGESDGTCHGGPAAGTFWPEAAVGLARAAGWSG